MQSVNEFIIAGFVSVIGIIAIIGLAKCWAEGKWK